jgi:hypothetical protein
MKGRRSRMYCSNACQQAAARRVKIAEWLATGSGRPDSKRGHYVRTYVLDDQEGVCALCGIEAAWNGAPLEFVLDHIDGDSDNNRRANLRLLCPNCDSQLPTFKSRNRGRGRHSRRQRYADGLSF